MQNEIEFIELDDVKKRILLDILGYSVNVDGLLIKKDSGELHICPITHETVQLDRASILPWNSNIVINTTPLSLVEYLA